MFLVTCIPIKISNYRKIRRLQSLWLVRAPELHLFGPLSRSVKQPELAVRTGLFFGDRSSKTDYLYGEEWDSYQEDGILSNLDLAWSRDQAEKVYVQHKMLEKGAELWRWLNDGAVFYVCGDASRMAKDVD